MPSLNMPLTAAGNKYLFQDLNKRTNGNGAKYVLVLTGRKAQLLGGISYEMF